MSQAVATQRRLREERDRAQRYLEVASTLVVVLDQRGRVELINRQGCELLGFEESELLGRDWFGTAVPAVDRLDARLAFMRLVAGVDAPGSSLEALGRAMAAEEHPDTAGTAPVSPIGPGAAVPASVRTARVQSNPPHRDPGCRTTASAR